MTNASSRGGAPTVVLVHGAFADSSSWNGVVARLMAAGVTVKAVPNPLRGVSEDAAYVASALQQTQGPVLAVGHSYGGAVITNAASRADNVVGLVYVAAFAPDEGESLMDIEGNSKDSVLTAALLQVRYPTAAGTETEFLIDPAKFHDAFAADLSEKDAAVMAVVQRPASSLAFSTPTTDPAWRRLPSWAVVATGDKAAGSDVVLHMAERAGATVTEVDASHVVMVTQAQTVTDVIMQALDTLSR
ncbi:alpha/beta fold hydrolase [Micromonospora robiginosa]|uniref:Alpha/beta hydrolase n=1 Tax=Micromonospora robiginosa TaxID=2749844 RepID=A0A7L6B3P8_9ACTN|nr:alpha/beta hydrolase [Micromonospora ferruginea]QLQ36567.1 alpha/beta hydrolase [Micromonospora ferruginea]